MKVCWILFAAILLIGIYVPSEAARTKRSLQDFIDQFVDIDKFKQDGLNSINSTAMKRIWNFFKAKFNRNYATTGEEKQRLGIFRGRLKTVIQSKFQEGITYTLAINNFSDLTKDEFLKLKTGLIPIQNTSIVQRNSRSVRRHLTERFQNQYDLTKSKRSLRSRENQNLRGLPDWFWNFFNSDDNDDDNNDAPTADEFDWRAQNVVTSVKDQGNCGSCYAFATTAVMESLYAIKTKSQDPIDLSPQQLVDCSESAGNSGCSGGLFQPSVEYLSGEGGQFATLDSYPYTGEEGTCESDDAVKVDLGNIETGDIDQGDEKGLAVALVNYGPIFIGLHVTEDAFMSYKSGVINIPNCPNDRDDMQHALTLVGFGYDNGLQTSYWAIKNSWGTSWGENGYLRLAMNAGNMCGVTSLASWATLT